MRQKTWLRVHVIPPLDGIYAQWDFHAGRMTRYYNPTDANGVPVDGSNDEVFGNLDDPCNSNYDDNILGTGLQLPGTPLNGLDPNQVYRKVYQQAQLCQASPYHQSIDLADPTFESANASLQWNETAGPFGTIVDRYQIDRASDITPGGLPQSLMAAALLPRRLLLRRRHRRRPGPAGQAGQRRRAAHDRERRGAPVLDAG